MSERAFKDLLFHGDTKVQMIVANEGVPRYCVTLRRDGHNGVGEEIGIVEVTRHDRLLTGDEPDLEQELDKLREQCESDAPDPKLRLAYSNTLDKCEGYAQGALDALRLLLDVAGDST